jgi:isopropylmalate/homocitrate/citramalate synthase
VPKVIVCDVGPRDGLQSAGTALPAAVRAGLVERLAAAGVPRIEAASFVHPERVPAMAGAEELVAALSPATAARSWGLVLNRRGYERLAVTALGGVRVTVAVSDAFNRRNAGASAADGLAAAVEIVSAARVAGLATCVVLATAFGCPFAGEVDTRAVLAAARQVAAAGPDEIVFADTIGVAVPRQVRALVPPALDLAPAIGVHMHNTRNTGYLTTYAAIECGARVVDASIGGIGGCPFAPGATGNIATEDLVYALDREGVATGVGMASLLETASWLREALGVPLDGQLNRAGTFPPAAARE